MELEPVTVLDRGYVKLIEKWGQGEAGVDEAGIIEAARQSTQGAFRGWGPFHEPWCQLHPDYHNDEACKPKFGDEKLLKYLYDHKHVSPSEFAGMAIEVQAPIFVIREWQRHRSIAVSEEISFNELSSRYSELPDLYYIPSVARLMAGKQSQKNKQGSEDGFTEQDAFRLQADLQYAVQKSRDMYKQLLASGLSRELARLILPVSQYSRMRCSANLRGWLAFLELRLAPEAQQEIREYAQAVAALVKTHFPRSYKLVIESL